METNLNALREALYAKENEMAAQFEAVREAIYAHPELGCEEVWSADYLCELMRGYGFAVTRPYGGLDTAFRAELNCGEGPKIAFLAEYDALPGYGPDHDQKAHACGHNWIAASTLGAAVLLAQFKKQLSGSIVLIGTPAEETLGGKCDLVEAGCFDDIDAVFQMHLGAENNIHVVSLAMDSLQFDFVGKAAHAAAYPHLGINALDAAQLTFAGINALRQHMPNDARVHGIVTHGGAAANIVPETASCQFYIRAKTRETLETLTERIINCAKGAALMTGASLNVHNFENSYDDLVYSEPLRKLLKENLEALGVMNFVPESNEASGSTDIGNVSHVCPTVYCEIETGACPPVYAHNEDFLAYVHGVNADHSLHTAIKAMAYSALQVYRQPQLLKETASLR